MALTRNTPSIAKNPTSSGHVPFGMSLTILGKDDDDSDGAAVVLSSIWLNATTINQARKKMTHDLEQ